MSFGAHSGCGDCEEKKLFPMDFGSLNWLGGDSACVHSEESGETAAEGGGAEGLDEGEEEEVDAGEHHGEDPVRRAQVALTEEEQHQGQGAEEGDLQVQPRSQISLVPGF